MAFSLLAADSGSPPDWKAWPIMKVLAPMVSPVSARAMRVASTGRARSSPTCSASPRARKPPSSFMSVSSWNPAGGVTVVFSTASVRPGSSARTATGARRRHDVATQKQVGLREADARRGRRVRVCRQS